MNVTETKKTRELNKTNASQDSRGTKEGRAECSYNTHSKDTLQSGTMY